MSVLFNGSSSEAHISSSFGGMTFNSTKTICGWFKSTTNSVEQHLFAQIDSNGSGVTDVGLALNSSGLITGFANGGLTSGFGAYSANLWYFVYACRTASSFSDENGVASAGSGFGSDGVFTTQGNNVLSTATTLWNTFWLGKRGSASLRWFSGEMCCVRVFNTKLTKAALRLEAVSPTAVDGSIVADWRMTTYLSNADLVSGSFGLAGTDLAPGTTEPLEITPAVTTPMMGQAVF